MRLIFMGTPEFALKALEAIVNSNEHEVIAVYSQPPRPAGRGHKETPSPVQAYAESKGIKVLTPLSLKGSEAQAEFAALRAEIAVVAAYGLILPQAILDAPLKGCLNIHASLLPRWRGAAPIQRAIEAGDAETGITIMRMDQGLDTGPMLLKASIPITPRTTAANLHDALATLGGELIIKALQEIDTLPEILQPTEGVTYAKKLGKDEGKIDWSLPAEALERKVRALNPWPGVWFSHNGERIKLLEAAIGKDNGPAGKILDRDLKVGCGKESLQLLRLQRAGKSPLSASEFLRGYSLSSGDILE